MSTDDSAYIIERIMELGDRAYKEFDKMYNQNICRDYIFQTEFEACNIEQLNNCLEKIIYDINK